MHDDRIIALDKMRVVPIAAHQFGELLAADACQHRRVGDLETVQMQDRQHHAITCRIQEFIRVPTGRERSGFSFAIANYASDDQVGIVKRGTIGVRQ